MNRTTDDLLDALLSKQDLPEYFEENDAELLRQTLAQELNALVEAHGLKKSEVIAGAQIERSYGYQLFSGRRGTPSRDVLLSLALSMRLTLPETQTLLRTARCAMLYPRVRRDSVIIHALAEGFDVVQCNMLLESYGETILGEES
ncbi:helix-turn-helix transcriptional regulator [uncultured Gemmiger sp.]|uniref:helix-turn-helix domain-containing protein n=1 Tax=uncultured Gemmiger sp. TaxID=1623490 RepID=UPI0025E6F596|nr:helix-turn-helix transcriptional regulator [uncultured Gemmiger sp.]